MPTLPSVSNVARVRIFTYDSQTRHQSVNIHHFRWDSGVAAATDMDALADQVAAAYNTLYSTAYISPNSSMDGQDAQDLSNSSGAYGSSVNFNRAGAGSVGTFGNVAACMNWRIGRRYRGGKPKTFIGNLSDSALGSESQFSAGFITALNAWATALYSGSGAVLTHTYPNISGLHLVNVSYFSGYTNYTRSSGRESSRPTLRVSPLVDTIIGANLRTLPSSQRRRMLAS